MMIKWMRNGQPLGDELSGGLMQAITHKLVEKDEINSTLNALSATDRHDGKYECVEGQGTYHHLHFHYGSYGFEICSPKKLKIILSSLY